MITLRSQKNLRISTKRSMSRKHQVLTLLVLMLIGSIATAIPTWEAKADSIGTSIIGFLGLNENKSPFGDVRVRRAISYSIDREDICEAIGKDFAHPSFSIVTSHLSSEKCFPDYDPERAKELLREGGYPDGFELDILSSRVSAPCLPCPGGSGGDVVRRITAVLCENLAAIGIDVNIMYVDMPVFYQYLTVGESSAFLYFLSFVDFSAPLDYVTMFLKDFPSAFEGISFTSPVVDELLLRLKKAGDNDEGARLTAELEHITVEETRLIPIWEIIYYADAEERLFVKESISEDAILFRGQDFETILAETGWPPENVKAYTDCRLGISHFFPESNDGIARAVFGSELDEIVDAAQELLGEPVEGEVPEPTEDRSFQKVVELLEKLLEGRDAPIAEAVDPTSRIIGYKSFSVLGSTINAKMKSSMKYYLWPPWAWIKQDDVRGSGSVWWRGQHPYYADEVRYAHKWEFSGIGVSVSIPAGVGFAASGSTASFSCSKKREWVITLKYNGVKPRGCVMWRAESVTGAFRFGSNWYMTVANDSDWL